MKLVIVLIISIMMVVIIHVFSLYLLLKGKVFITHLCMKYKQAKVHCYYDDSFVCLIVCLFNCLFAPPTHTRYHYLV